MLNKKDGWMDGNVMSKWMDGWMTNEEREQ